MKPVIWIWSQSSGIRFTEMRSSPSSSSGRHHGAVFITALGVVMILAALTLVLAQRMRTESVLAANWVAGAQADAIEQGAESWVEAQVEANRPDAVTILNVPAEAIPLGNGYFWILRANPASDQKYTYGITDESAKVNLNVATSAQLQTLPNMTQQIADAIQDWRSPADAATSYGAETSYYGSLPEPYNCKNAAYESVEELLLVKDVTRQLLHGSDLNQDGVVSYYESQAGGGLGANFGSSNFATRGWFNDLTVYSAEPNVSNSGARRVNVNSNNSTALSNALKNALSASRADQIVNSLRSSSGITGTRFPNLAAFYVASKMSQSEFALVADVLTTSGATSLPGLVNVNTAPKEVLMCLRGLAESDADALIAARGSDTRSIAWAFGALSSAKAAGIANQITARSFVYSADIVAVSGDGRAFKRIRIVVDAQQLPAKIVFRKDLTSLGWALPDDIRQSLRSGQPITTNGTNSNFGGMPGK